MKERKYILFSLLIFRLSSAMSQNHRLSKLFFKKKCYLGRGYLVQMDFSLKMRRLKFRESQLVEGKHIAGKIELLSLQFSLLPCVACICIGFRCWWLATKYSVFSDSKINITNNILWWTEFYYFLLCFVWLLESGG